MAIEELFLTGIPFAGISKIDFFSTFMDLFTKSSVSYAQSGELEQLLNGCYTIGLLPSRLRSSFVSHCKTSSSKHAIRQFSCRGRLRYRWKSLDLNSDNIGLQTTKKRLHLTEKNDDGFIHQPRVKIKFWFWDNRTTV